MEFSKSLVLFVLTLTLSFACAKVARSQSEVNASVSGTVADSTGAVVTAASITVTNLATGVKQASSVTNEVGFYVIPNLQPGTYNVSIKKDGFRECVGSGLLLQSADSRNFSCTLQAGSISEQVTVEAGALQVETEQSQLSRDMDSKQVEDLPSNGRNFANLLALQPGVAGISFDSMNALNTFATQGLSVNGSTDYSNNIMVDGISAQRTRANAAQVAPPSMDSIGELKIVSAGYMPEYSRGGGAQVIVTLKSGTDHYHGSLYEYNRNTAYNAKNFFATEPTPINLNDFGGTLGGPLIPHHNKLFFFYSQEIVKWPGSTFYQTEVPSILAREGNFSEDCAPGSGSSCPIVPTYLAGRTDPNTGQTLVSGQPFPNDTIAQAFWSANGAGFMATMATPTASGVGLNYSKNLRSPSDNSAESLKIDYNISPKNHLAVSLRFYRNTAANSWWSGSSQIINVRNDPSPSRGISFNLSTTFSPTLINDLTVGHAGDVSRVDLTNGLQEGLNRTSLGVNYPYIFGPGSKDIPGKLPTINVCCVDSVGSFTSSFPSNSAGQVYQYQDVLTKLSGRHILKMGVWIEHDGENDNDQLQFAAQNLNGTFNFNADPGQNPATTGAPVADMLLGNYDSYSELGYRNYTPWVAWQEGVFAQDSWKVTPHLTIQGGLRWDYFPPYHSRWCNFAMFNPFSYSRAPGIAQEIATNGPDAGNVIGGNPYNGISMPCSELPVSGEGHFGVFGQGYNASTRDAINQQLIDAGILHGGNSTLLQSHFRNFQPRVGFSWDPFGKATTVLRGSAGIFYSHLTLNDATLMGSNAPFQTAATVLGGVVDCPGGNLSATRQCLGSSGTNGIVNAPIPITGQDPNNPTPVLYQWTLGAQHMLPDDMLLDVTYVGTRGRHLALLANLNEMRPGTVQANPGVPLAALNPYPGFSAITEQINAGNSYYDSLQVSLQKHMRHGLLFSLAYTYANSFDDGSGLYSSVVDHYDLAYNKGPSDWLRHHTLIINSIYELPFFLHRNDFAGRVLGGWQVGGVATIESGLPYTIHDSGRDISGMGFDQGERVDIVPGCDPNSGPKTLAKWFNTACFVMPAPGTLGNAGRNDVWGPDVINFDFSLFKNGNISGERLKYQFKAEAFNVFNHPSFGYMNGPFSTGVLSGQFGRVQNVGDPRQLQLGLRVIF